MKIVTNNVDSLLTTELSKHCKIVNLNEKPAGAFIVWENLSSSSFERQINIIDHCIKNGVPLIVFDRNQTMTEDEIMGLVRPGIFLWEPALNDRMFFSYQPIWGKLYNNVMDAPYFEGVRNISLGYKGFLSKKVPMFGEYYKPVNDIGEFRVAFVDEEHNVRVNEKVHEMGIPIVRDIPITDIKTTILLGTERQCKTGYIDPRLFDYLENGVVPLLPCEHRWYHSMFGDLVVSKPSDVEFVLKCVDRISFGLISDVYTNLSKHLPECDVENVAVRITKYFS